MLKKYPLYKKTDILKLINNLKIYYNLNIRYLYIDACPCECINYVSNSFKPK